MYVENMDFRVIAVSPGSCRPKMLIREELIVTVNMENGVLIQVDARGKEYDALRESILKMAEEKFKIEAEVALSSQ